MPDPPRHDWSAYEALIRPYADAQLRSRSSRERFAIYADLHRLLTRGRPNSPSSKRLERWRFEQTITVRQATVAALSKLDALYRERAASKNAD